MAAVLIPNTEETETSKSKKDFAREIVYCILEGDLEKASELSQDAEDAGYEVMVEELWGVWHNVI